MTSPITLLVLKSYAVFLSAQVSSFFPIDLTRALTLGSLAALLVKNPLFMAGKRSVKALVQQEFSPLKSAQYSRSSTTAGSAALRAAI